MSMTPNSDSTADNQAIRRSKSLESGFSLLARGEPQVWFIGGMLVLCLLAIVGLLALVVAKGIPSFWPRSVQWMLLDDGSLEIGQPQEIRREDQESKDGPSRPQKVRRFYRTGNYDLTGVHYRWLEESQLTSAGIALPDTAMVVERREWGRLYGLPLQAHETLPPEMDDADLLEKLDGLIAAIEFCELPPETSTSVMEQLQQLRRTKLSDALGKWSAPRQLESDDQVRSSVLQCRRQDDEQWVPLEETSGEEISEVRRLYTTSQSSLDALNSTLPAVHATRSQMERTQYDISRLDSRIAELRAAIRRAELETDQKLVAQVEQIHFVLEQLSLSEYYENTLSNTATWLSQIVGDNELPQSTLRELEGAPNDALQRKRQSLQDELESWLSPVRGQAPAILAAVSDYVATYQSIAAEKRPLQNHVNRLEADLKRFEMAFVVPSDPTSLEGVARYQLERLGTGIVGAELQEKLAEYGWQADESVANSQSLSERISIFTIADSNHGLHCLALTRPAYISSPASESQSLVLLSSKIVPAAEIVRAVAVNRLTLPQKLTVYFDRWREFLVENPREANTEGGVFPAIWGTIVMTLIMTIAVVPFGVMAALYLREYAGNGPLVALIRISINNLAGVPSIVYGVFGFSFFCYTIGAYIDGGPTNADISTWPSHIWFMATGVAALTGTLAFFAGMFGTGPSHQSTRLRKWSGRLALVLWLVCLALVALLILKSPFFNGFYREYLPNPTFGKGGLLWASLTLSLLTLPVVIVATEEALSAVPNSLREGSLACGASKWQTIQRIVLPHARPGILTGAILAMARGAGEVAPLMLVGALPTAQDLPLDSEFPFFHGSRSFMHLGYQIYALGFQSQNSDAAVPMVFTCTLLLILIVASLNLFAILLRARLRKRFLGNQF